MCESRGLIQLAWNRVGIFWSG